jgi:broad specificity phosphatase PhoE
VRSDLSFFTTYFHHPSLSSVPFILSDAEEGVALLTVVTAAVRWCRRLDPSPTMKKLLLMQLLPVLCLVSGSIQVVSSFAPSSEAGSRRRHHQRRVSSTQRRNSLDHHHRHHHNRVVEDEEETNDSHDLDAAAFCHPRRKFLRQVMIGSTAAASSLLLGSSTGTTFPAAVPPALARGLASFPCEAPLLNVYHLMRAGTSLLEEEDIWSTNPLFLTNREAALSSTGVEEAQAASRVLQEADIQPSVIKYSLAASSVDTASVIRDELKVGQNRLIPEFTFMDPRALGKYDMMSLSETFPAIVAMDDLEAGYDGKGEGARPPPNTDGTPQDTLADQAIRLRQLMSGT